MDTTVKQLLIKLGSNSNINSKLIKHDLCKTCPNDDCSNSDCLERDDFIRKAKSILAKRN